MAEAAIVLAVIGARPTQRDVGPRRQRHTVPTRWNGRRADHRHRTHSELRRQPQRASSRRSRAMRWSAVAARPRKRDHCQHGQYQMGGVSDLGDDGTYGRLVIHGSSAKRWAKAGSAKARRAMCCDWRATARRVGGGRGGARAATARRQSGKSTSSRLRSCARQEQQCPTLGVSGACQHGAAPEVVSRRFDAQIAMRMLPSSKNTPVTVAVGRRCALAPGRSRFRTRCRRFVQQLDLQASAKRAHRTITPRAHRQMKGWLRASAIARQTRCFTRAVSSARTARAPTHRSNRSTMSASSAAGVGFADSSTVAAPRPRVHSSAATQWSVRAAVHEFTWTSGSSVQWRLRILRQSRIVSQAQRKRHVRKRWSRRKR